VDGGSTDGTAELARRWGCKVYVQPRTNRAEARNFGVMKAKGNIVAFIDSDCIAESDWLEKLTRKLVGNKDKSIAGVAGRTLAANRDKLIPYLIELASCASNGIHYATWNIAYRKDVVLEVGGFDERLHAAEDQALAWKVLRKGYKIVWEPEAIVYHKHRETLLSFLKQQYEYGKWAVIAKRLYGISYYRSLLLVFAWPILLLYKYFRMVKHHPILPIFLAISAIAYSLGAWRGLLCKLES